MCENVQMQCINVHKLIVDEAAAIILLQLQ